MVNALIQKEITQMKFGKQCEREVTNYGAEGCILEVVLANTNAWMVVRFNLTLCLSNPGLCTGYSVYSARS